MDPKAPCDRLRLQNRYLLCARKLQQFSTCSYRGAEHTPAAVLLRQLSSNWTLDGTYGSHVDSDLSIRSTTLMNLIARFFCFSQIYIVKGTAQWQLQRPNACSYSDYSSLHDPISGAARVLPRPRRYRFTCAKQCHSKRVTRTARGGHALPVASRRATQ
jgi:hypothetical protein